MIVLVLCINLLKLSLIKKKKKKKNLVLRSMKPLSNVIHVNKFYVFDVYISLHLP